MGNKSYREENKKLIGKKFNKLTINNIFVKMIKGSYIVFAECSCDCGNDTTVRLRKVKEGHTQSCGCLNKEQAKKHFKSLKREVGFLAKLKNKLEDKKNGIYFKKDTKTWFCKIRINGKAYSKNGFNKKSEAIKARNELYDIYLKPLIELLEQGYTLNKAFAIHSEMFKTEKKEKISLINQRFGKNTIIEEMGRNKYGNLLVKCKCDCGSERIITYNSLAGGRNNSCGCYIKEIENNYGKLTVIEEVKKNKHGQRRFKCKCECGNETIVDLHSLKQGNTKSCGCLIKEAVTKKNKKSITKTTEKYKKWIGRKKSKLTIKDVFFDEDKRRHCFVCDCDCGNETIIRVDNFRKHEVISCGCIGSSLANEEIFEKATLNRLKNDKIPSHNTSGIVGVRFVPQIGLWKAELQSNGVRYVQHFHYKSDAIAYRNFLKDKYHKPRVAGIKTNKKKPEDE